MGTGTVLGFVWAPATVCFNPLEWSVPAQVLSSHTCADWCSLDTWREAHAGLWSSRFVQLSLLMFCPIYLAALLFLEFQVCFLSSGTLPGSACSSSLCCGLETPRAVSWENCRVCLIVVFISSITILHCLMSSVLKTIASCMLSVY